MTVYDVLLCIALGFVMIAAPMAIITSTCRYVEDRTSIDPGTFLAGLMLVLLGAVLCFLLGLSVWTG